MEYKISVIMAVYNAGPFLKEAVDSLINQTIGIENIQIILVDDGSSDESPAICDEYANNYPDNIFVVHKVNGGVASARNEGLKYAEGRFLNFMDSDDIMETDAFEKMYNFFIAHEDETDIVTIPLQFFDAMTGPHWQNNKFNNGSRVIDLQKEPNHTLMFVNASLFSGELRDKIEFDPTLPCGEDIKVIYTHLIKKMTLGVVSDTCYWYRRRSVGGASLIATAHGKKSWYFDYFYNLQFWVLDYYKNELGYIPDYVKYVFASETQWRFRKDSNNIVQRNILTESEFEKYKELLRLSIQEIDDDMLVSEPYIYFEQRLFLLLYKYNAQKAQLVNYNGDILVGFNDCIVGKLSSALLEVNIVSIKDNTLKIEGLATLPRTGYAYNIGYKIKDIFYPAEWLPFETEEQVLDTDILNKRAFSIAINLNDIDKDACVKFALMVDDKCVDLSNIDYKHTSPITNKNKNIFYSAKDYIVYAERHWVSIVKADDRVKSNKNKKLMKSLFADKKNPASLKAFITRSIMPVLARFKKKEIWLISDRYTKAGDNGEAFFRYMMDKKDVDSYFLLFKTSDDYDRLNKFGKVVEPYSWKHKMLHLLSDVIVSAHADDFVVNPFRNQSVYYQDILADKKFVFLQHGIINNDISDWYNRLKINADVFVTSALSEYESIRGERYLYENKEVCLTGLPRYDLLEDKKEKKITFMPTWRAYLVEDWGDGSGNRRVKDSFNKSSYFKMYMELLNNQDLIEAARKNDYTIQWVVHPNMRDTVDKMLFDESVEIVSSDVAYKDIFAKSSMVVTDYSSVMFDMAYLRKPVLYYHADKDEFYSGGHTQKKGYFEHERDGFGEVEYTSEDMINRLIEYMENDCKLKDIYNDRINKFFAYNDKNNCQRVYEAIRGIEK
ncbi:MAG: CDP-glycerol glycerophosphotransferase family protein [Oscillospiraceae bacterium]|nr:CDP-glycerol glycerophosphotransferase family protein [Oscillospiraceae bacterium]